MRDALRRYTAWGILIASITVGAMGFIYFLLQSADADPVTSMMNVVAAGGWFIAVIFVGGQVVKAVDAEEVEPDA